MKHFSEVTPAGERVLDVAEELIAGWCWLRRRH